MINNYLVLELSSGEISIEDFMKIDLRVGVVKSVQRIERSENLYRIMVDLGEIGERQIIAGIAKYYNPDELIGKNIIVVVNLKPKKIFGEVSQGMLLAAEDNGIPILLTTIKQCRAGVRVR
uniref:Methionine--tRNA ligase n=1 Tax=Staphylothermus marinus TaxID=2280 RepID=A0A7C4D905_STAMA